jgi:exopolyphosphatase / guanosine-5'-triphosphate,3'-diphosphate pyrophosphatase
MIIAAIDIGSNAARLLINEVKTTNKKTEFIKLNLLRIPLRLGMDVFTLGKIGEEREKMVLDAMKIFSDLMKIYKVEHYRACATSARIVLKISGKSVIFFPNKISEFSILKISVIFSLKKAME